MKLYDVSRQYSKRGRLKEMYENLSDFSELDNEEVEDVLFSMLTTFFDKTKAELAKKINTLWTEQTENVNLTVNEYLANRIDLLQTKKPIQEAI